MTPGLTPGLTLPPAGALTAPASGTSRRGTCPTLTDPMQTGDGLLARIRVENRALSPAQLGAIAILAAEHGNGVVEITTRGNLQVRGLTPSNTKPFADAVNALLPIEAGLVVDCSPIAGLDPVERANPLALVHALRAGTASMADRLGPKVSVVVDGDGQIPLGALKADIRISALPDQRWALTLGGSKVQILAADAAIATSLAVLGALAAIGPEARATDLFPINADSPAPAIDTTGWDSPLRLHQGHTVPLALPFGSVQSGDLLAFASAAAAEGVTTLRLAPDHVLLVDNASDRLVERADELGFITRRNDPRRRISACIGDQGCASGQIASRIIATRLAPEWAAEGHLHVSGCAKGCAHPRRATLTIVGRPDGIGLVSNGRASDTPQQVMDEAQLADAIRRQQDAR